MRGTILRGVVAAVLALGTLAIAPLAAAQQVAMPLRLRTGEQYTVTVADRSSVETPAGPETYTVSSVWALDIVQAAQPDATWRWTPVSFDIEAVETADPGATAMMNRLDLQALSDGLSAMVRIVADIGFECRVDRTGRCMAMSNWPMWSARFENTVLMAEAFGRMAMSTIPGGVSAEARKAAFAAGEPTPAAGPSDAAAMWAQYRTPVMRAFAALIDGVDDRAAAGMMSGLYPISAVQGRTLTVGQTTEFTEEWAAPYGAPPILVRGTLTLESYDAASGTAVVVRTAEVDPESVQRTARVVLAYIMQNVVGQISDVMGDTMPMDAEALMQSAEMVLSMFTITYGETTRGTVDVRTGLARETATEYRWALQMADMSGAPAGGGEDATAPVAPASMVSGTGTMTMVVTRGAPQPPRLPRAAGR